MASCYVLSFKLLFSSLPPICSLKCTCERIERGNNERVNDIECNEYKQRQREEYKITLSATQVHASPSSEYIIRFATNAVLDLPQHYNQYITETETVSRTGLSVSLFVCSHLSRKIDKVPIRIHAEMLERQLLPFSSYSIA